MKASTPFLLLCVAALSLIAVAFVAGRFFEKNAAAQTNIAALTTRVNQLETINMKRDVRWAWINRIGSRIPLVRRLVA